MQCAAAIPSQFDDPLTPAAVRSYFRALYSNRSEAFFDSAKLDGQPFSVLGRIGTAGRGLRFDFDSIARAFRLIENDEPAVIVPWRATPDDSKADQLLHGVAAAGPSRDSLRALQRYVVPVPRPLYREWLIAGMLRPVHPALGDALLRLEDDVLYDEATGARVFNPTDRHAESNVF